MQLCFKIISITLRNLQGHSGIGSMIGDLPGLIRFAGRRPLPLII